MDTFKIGSYSFAAAIVASFGALLIGACLFGLNPAEWTEIEGRFVGVLATIAGIAGAAIGLRRALANVN